MHLRAETVLRNALEMSGRFANASQNYAVRIKDDLGSLSLRQGKTGAAGLWYSEAAAARLGMAPQ